MEPFILGHGKGMKDVDMESIMATTSTNKK